MRNIRNCSVAVVGGAGFLGSHLVNHLIEDRHCKVLVVDNLISGRREFVHKDAIFEHADITDSEEYLRKMFLRYKIHYVFNYAASPYIPVSFARPLHVSNVNFFGAMKVINAAQESDCEAILQVSSAEIYGEGNPFLETTDIPGGTPKPGIIDEECLVRPHSTYGVGKAAIDYFVQTAWRERKTPCIALRQFNCVGERETHPYVIPEIIGQLAAQQVCARQEPGKGTAIYREQVDGGRWEADSFDGRGVVKLGNNSFRDFLYAGDQAKIAVELLERGQFGEVVNLGSETGIKIYDLAVMIGKLMGFKEVKVELDPARVRPWEIWHLQSDNSKIKSLFSAGQTTGSWKPIFNPTSLEEALQKTIAWYESNGRRWPWE